MCTPPPFPPNAAAHLLILVVEVADALLLVVGVAAEALDAELDGHWESVAVGNAAEGATSATGRTAGAAKPNLQ